MAAPAPRWAGRTVYQVHSLGAAGAPPVNPDVDGAAPVGHGLRRIEDWLDHVAGLGCGGLLLTPIFVAESHGYDTVDPFRVDQRLGDDEDFDRLVQACHQRDLLLVLDGVFNHVGRAFPRFREVVAARGRSDQAAWFHIDLTGDDGEGFAYRCFEGHPGLVTLNHREPAVLEWAVAVARHWLDRGADGWRLDAAYAIPSAFLAALADGIRAAHPDAYVFGEIIHGDYPALVASGHLDSATQYELYKAVWSSLNDANLFELAWALKRHRGFAESFVPVTFVGNHDVTRLASQLQHPAHLGPAVALLLTVPGRPCVYYGDELAWRGVKEARAGGDDAVRPGLPESAEAETPAAVTALELHRGLIGWRRDHAWVDGADVEVVATANRSLYYALSSDPLSAGPDRRLVVVDLGPEGAADGEPPTPPAPDGWAAELAGPGFAVCRPAPAA